MAVAFHRIAKGYDSAPHYKGLPDDVCRCTHWGHMLKSKIRMQTKGADEIL
jgi:hypothetical protein